MAIFSRKHSYQRHTYRNTLVDKSIVIEGTHGEKAILESLIDIREKYFKDVDGHWELVDIKRWVE